MKSLKESILSSNEVNIISAIKDIILSDATSRKVRKLNELWKALKLDLSDFEWTHNRAKHYLYVYTKDGDFIERDFLAAGKHYAGNLLVAVDVPNIGVSKELSKIYKDHLMKTLHLTEVASNEDWYYLNFK